MIFFSSLWASGYIFISGDMMRLLPSHHAAVQRKELKIGIFYVFIHSHICSSYDSIPGGFVLKSKNHLWLTDLPLKKHWIQYIRNMSTARRPWGHLQFHLIHAFILFNLSHPLLVQLAVFSINFFKNPFSLYIKTERFQRSWDIKTGVFGNLQHHLRETFHW